MNNPPTIASLEAVPDGDTQGASTNHPGQLYQDALTAAFAAIDARTAQRATAVELETAKLAAGGLSTGVIGHLSVDTWRVENEMTEAVFRSLIAHAEKTFAAPGAVLKLDLGDLRSIYQRPHEQDSRRVDPVRLWDVLAERFGGARGAQVSHRQAADAIRSFFGLSRRSTVVMAGGCVCLSHDVSIDDFTKANFSRTELTIHSREGLQRFISPLTAFSHWADMQYLAECYARFATSFTANTQLAARSRHVLCGQLTVICYQKRFEFRLERELAAKLQLFLGTYPDGSFK